MGSSIISSLYEYYESTLKEKGSHRSFIQNLVFLCIETFRAVNLFKGIPLEALEEVILFIGALNSPDESVTLLCAILATLPPTKQLVVTMCLQFCIQLQGDTMGFSTNSVVAAIALPLCYSSNNKEKRQRHEKLIRWMLTSMTHLIGQKHNQVDNISLAKTLSARKLLDDSYPTNLSRGKDLGGSNRSVPLALLQIRDSVNKLNR
jgi:hypothetical protein